ncbi:glycosyltransferase family 39 protein [Streptomyces sp. NPDC046887]|uniref:glycosyltransferase family 39 protein n=1 Tax=Streptomyces sp. NPDC046887 TaxID=3155472 RepID=UPI0033E32185
MAQPQAGSRGGVDTAAAGAGAPLRLPASGRRPARRRATGQAAAALARARPALLAYAAVRALGLALALARTDRSALDLLAGRWDSAWYLLIAEQGYAGSCPAQGELCRYAFFPLYPVLIRTAATLTPLPAPWAALLLSLTASGVAAWGVYAVAERCAGRRTAFIATVLWGVLPHAVVESMAYTESLFTALAAWALYAVLTGRWPAAGALACLAGLTRPTGIAVAAAVGVSALLALRARPLPRRPALALALAPLGWLGWVAWTGVRAGRWDGYFVVQRRWGSYVDGGAYTWDRLGRLFARPETPLSAAAVAAVLAGAAVLLVVCVLQRWPLPLLVHSGLTLLITVGGAGYFHSKGRFLLPAFALLLPVAAALGRARPGVLRAVLLPAAVVSGLFGGHLLLVAGHSP